MIRRIIKINEEKCNGCGACAEACHEGAIEMLNGKAKLMREDYCDGLGDCLPECPVNAISFEEREAPEYNEAAVLAAKEKKENKEKNNHTGCLGMQTRQIVHNEKETAKEYTNSQLNQWPCQIKLVSVNASYFNDTRLLIAADCTAYAYANTHSEYMKDRVTLIGCPKLDNVDYSEKLTEIIKNNDIKSVTVLRMEVPCCGGLETATKKALQNSGKFIPWQIVTVSIDGKIIDN